MIVLSGTSTQELVTKLVRLAKGDLELVHRAIRANRVDDGPADLAKVVAYIEQHRRQEAIRRDKVPA